MNGLLPVPRFSVTAGSQINQSDFSDFSKVTHYLLLFGDIYPLPAVKFLIPKPHNSQTPSKASRFLRVCYKSITGEGLSSCKVWAFIWFGSSWAPCKILTQRISKMSKILPGLIFPIVNLVDLREGRLKKHWGFFSYYGLNMGCGSGKGMIPKILKTWERRALGIWKIRFSEHLVLSFCELPDHMGESSLLE